MKTKPYKGTVTPLRYLKVRAVARLLGFDTTSSVHQFLKQTGLPFILLNPRTFAIEEGPLMEWVQSRRMVYVKNRLVLKAVKVKPPFRATAAA